MPPSSHGKRPTWNRAWHGPARKTRVVHQWFSGSMFVSSRACQFEYLSLPVPKYLVVYAGKAIKESPFCCSSTDTFD